MPIDNSTKKHRRNDWDKLVSSEVSMLNKSAKQLPSSKPSSEANLVVGLLEDPPQGERVFSVSPLVHTDGKLLAPEMDNFFTGHAAEY